MSTTWAAWAERLFPEITRPGARVLVDGRSGSGKSSLVADVVRVARASGTRLQVLHLDHVYPGWDGLDAGSAIVPGVLAALAEGDEARWVTWNWRSGCTGPERGASPAHPFLVEGVGAITRASVAHATTTVWVETPDDVRHERAMRRDGALYRPHWRRWADQEDALIARERPAELADLVIDGAIPGTSADPGSSPGG